MADQVLSRLELMRRRLAQEVCLLRASQLSTSTFFSFVVVVSQAREMRDLSSELSPAFPSPPLFLPRRPDAPNAISLQTPGIIG